MSVRCDERGKELCSLFPSQSSSVVLSSIHCSLGTRSHYRVKLICDAPSLSPNCPPGVACQVLGPHCLLSPHFTLKSSKFLKALMKTANLQQQNLTNILSSQLITHRGPLGRYWGKFLTLLKPWQLHTQTYSATATIPMAQLHRFFPLVSAETPSCPKLQVCKFCGWYF